MGCATAHQHHQRHQEQPDDTVKDGIPVQQRVEVAAADDGPDEEHRHGHVAVAGALESFAEKGGQLALGQHEGHAHEHRQNTGVSQGLAEDGAVAYVSRTPLREGDVGIFSVNGKVLCRQYDRDDSGTVYLFSLNRRRADGDVTLPAAEAGTLICFGRVLTGTLSNRN